tara:strand:- start:575 stop:928 length:354 start_codon:yes stop_codon:yes gene_type:complete
MSEPVRCTANTTATIWPIASKDEWGKTTYGAAYTVKCTFARGSTRQYNDANGIKYIPKSIFWYEFNGVYPNLNDKIALGEHSSVTNPLTVAGVELIKNRLQEDNSVLGDTDDIMVLT